MRDQARPNRAFTISDLEKKMPAMPTPSTAGSEKSAHPPQKSAATQADLLAHHGITEVPLVSYEWGGFRYTNAPDAIAAAKRGTPE